MSLLKTNWKDTFTEETRPKPDVEFIVNLEDGESLLTAHKYLLAFASPVFEEQFYGKNGRIEVKEGNARVRIKLDASACAAEAFLAYIYQKPIGNLSLKDMIQLLELCSRYQVDQLRDYAKECIPKLKQEMEDWETMHELHWIEEDVHVMSIEDQDDILQQIWEEDEEMVRCQRDEKMKREDEDLETMREVLWTDEVLSIEDQDDILQQIWNEDEEMVRCHYEGKRKREDEEWKIMHAWLDDEEATMREVSSGYMHYWNRKKPTRRATKKPCTHIRPVNKAPYGWTSFGLIRPSEVDKRMDLGGYFVKRAEGKPRQGAAEMRRQEKRKASCKPHEEPIQKSKKSKVNESVDIIDISSDSDDGLAKTTPISWSILDTSNRPSNRCANVSKICHNIKKRSCSFDLCGTCCKKQDKGCKGHPRK